MCSCVTAEAHSNLSLVWFSDLNANDIIDTISPMVELILYQLMDFVIKAKYKR